VHVIKIYGEGEVQLHSYEAPALYGGGQLRAAAALILGRVTCYPLSRRLDGPKNQPGGLREENYFFSYQESIHDISVVQSVL